MKACIALLLFIFSVLKFGYCQNKDKISIPIIKENAIVDSAINFILSGKAVPIVNGWPTNDRWIIFDIDATGNNGFSFSALKASENAINLLVNRLTYFKTGFGYFKYDGYFIYVTEEGSYNSFYTRTPKTTSFGFLHKLKSLEPTNDIKKQQEFWSYNYENGRFSRDTPPTIR